MPKKELDAAATWALLNKEAFSQDPSSVLGKVKGLTVVDRENINMALPTPNIENAHDIFIKNLAPYIEKYKQDRGS